jgi:hypothetical protein
VALSVVAVTAVAVVVALLVLLVLVLVLVRVALVQSTVVTLSVGCRGGLTESHRCRCTAVGTG